MSCDNIPHNGVVARNAVSGVARLYDKGLADWIAANAAFPNGMVDRITPATTDRERKLCSQDFGIEDNWPVYCEEFIQWVLEDTFCNGRPELEAAGVQFVPDVTPFEFMKIRILNGGHAAIAYPASLLDIHFVHDAMNHPLVGAFFAKIEREEIMPTVPPVPGVVLEDYYRPHPPPLLQPEDRRHDSAPCLRRLQPPAEIHRAGGARQAEGRGLRRCAGLRSPPCGAATASARRRRGRTSRRAIPYWARLTELAAKAKTDPLVWLTMDDVYGDVAKAEPFRKAFARSLTDIWSKGTARALADFVGA